MGTQLPMPLLVKDYVFLNRRRLRVTVGKDRSGVSSAMNDEQCILTHSIEESTDPCLIFCYPFHQGYLFSL